jgi:hypothetical protein
MTRTMSTGITFHSLVGSLKTYATKLNLFNTGSQNEQILENERRSTRLYLILLVTSMVLFTFYYCGTSVITMVVVEFPDFSSYSTLVHHSSLRCLCSKLAVKYEQFVQVEPTYHEVCRSDFVSDDWINRLFTAYQDHRSNSILSDFFRIGVFQFRTLRSLCQLARETIIKDIQLFKKTEFIQSLLISPQVFESQINSSFMMSIDSIHQRFLRELHFMQDTAAQSLLFTGASVTSLQPKYKVISNVAEASVPYYGIKYTFSDGSSCTCSSSTAVTCMGLATFKNDTVFDFQTGCYMLSALLKSTLKAFYNQTFVNMLTNSSDTFNKLDSSRSNQTIETLLSQMFVTHWSKTASFQEYFKRCAPDSCQYTLREQHSFLETVISLIGLFGGFSSVLRIVVPILTTTIWPAIWKFASRRRRTHVLEFVPDESATGIHNSIHVKSYFVLNSYCRSVSR